MVVGGIKATLFPLFFEYKARYSCLINDLGVNCFQNAPQFNERPKNEC